jgi:hypothetical protein
MVGIAMAADMNFTNAPDFAAELAQFRRSDEAREKLITVCPLH